MAESGAFVFTDPRRYQAAVHPAQIEILLTTKGEFHAELTRVALLRLWMQQGRENLPRVIRSTVTTERPPIFFLASADQAPMHHSGMKVLFGEIVAVGAGSSHHHRSWGPCHWASASLTQEELAAAGRAIAGRDLSVPSSTHIVRPAPRLMTRLMTLHAEVAQLARTTPDKLAHPEIARSLEQALIHVVIRCLTEGTVAEMKYGGRHHSTIIARFEEFLAANQYEPLYLAEICAGIGVSERTLRVCCQEHMGMGPVRYLWLRRMHLARRALMLADPAQVTVTETATAHGFWELGRFSTEYRALFGEQPSATLRRARDRVRINQNRPSVLPDSDFA